VRRKRVIIVLAACVLVGIGVVAFWPAEREPEYNGKKLSEWLRAYSLDYSNDAEKKIYEREQLAAADAIQHIGTNALPCLVRWIAYEPPVWKEKIGSFVVKIPSRTIARWYMESDRLGSGAVRGFEVLGLRAATALPELENVIKTSHRQFNQALAIAAMGHIGKDAFPYLLRALEDRKTRDIAAWSIVNLPRMGADISPAIPAFLLIDRETAEQEKKFGKFNSPTLHPGFDYLFWVLLSENRPFLIPALTNCLHHTNNDVRVEAAKTLGRLGTEARKAVPALKEALDVRVVAVQEAALDALEEIAPEVLTNGMKDF
jgi:hypothetical protein